MKMDWNTVYWSALSFAIAYVGVMLSAPAGVYFTFPALYAGLIALGGYHVGKGQDKGGVVDAARRKLDD